jgi:hypothetical protein
MQEFEKAKVDRLIYENKRQRELFGRLPILRDENFLKEKLQEASPSAAARQWLCFAAGRAVRCKSSPQSPAHGPSAPAFHCHPSCGRFTDIHGISKFVSVSKCI